VKPIRRTALPAGQLCAWRGLGLALVAAGLLLPAAVGANLPQTLATKSDSATYRPASFAIELRWLKDSIDKSDISAQQAAAIGASLPAAWKVDGRDGKYEVPSATLRRLLECAKCDADQRKLRLEQARLWLTALASQTDGYTESAGTEKSGARPKLDEILKRREFSAVRPPSKYELLQQRFNRWLLRMIGKLFENIGKHPIGAQTLFWLIVFLLVSWLALTLVRYWMRRARIEELKTVGAIKRHQSWQEWIRAGREAAARGDFREAIHSVYWASVTNLEDAGILSMDLTRTPREHLRLLGEAGGAPESTIRKQRDCLAALTSRLERVWYGRNPAGTEDFQACLQQAEELGCRLP
jgi:hypothetical protein